MSPFSRGKVGRLGRCSGALRGSQSPGVARGHLPETEELETSAQAGH